MDKEEQVKYEAAKKLINKKLKENDYLTWESSAIKQIPFNVRFKNCRIARCKWELEKFMKPQKVIYYFKTIDKDMKGLSEEDFIKLLFDYAKENPQPTERDIRSNFTITGDIPKNVKFFFTTDDRVFYGETYDDKLSKGYPCYGTLYRKCYKREYACYNMTENDYKVVGYRDIHIGDRIVSDYVGD